MPIASQSGLTGIPRAVGELRGGVTGALDVPPCITCKGGRPVLLLVLAVPLPFPDDRPFNHGISDVPSLAPGYELVGLADGEVHTSIRSTGGFVPCKRWSKF